MISVALFDVDGVVRHYEPPDPVEARWGLPQGVLADAAFDSDLLRRLTTGVLTREAWVREIGDRVGNHRAARDWASRPGRVDQDVLRVIGDLRAGGCPVVLFSNGSDELRRELAALDVTRHVDGVVNSAELGVAKPDRAAFERACEVVGCSPGSAAFVDDSPANVDAAAGLGMRTHRYTAVPALRQFLDELGLAGVGRGASP